MTQAKAQAKPAKDALDLLAEGPLEHVVMLMLWKQRFANPEMSMHIALSDIRGLGDCVAYLGVEPQLAVYRPQGRPAQEAIPAAQGKRAIPARPAEPPRPFVYVGLVDKQGNQLKPIENNEEDAERRDRAEDIRRAKEAALRLSGLLLGMCQQGTYSTAEITEAARALQTLAAGV